MEMAGAALVAFNLPESLVQQIQMGLGNTLARYYERQPGLPLFVRVFISAKAVSARRGEGVEPPADVQRTAGGDGRARGQGWGFFLVEKRLGEAQAEPAAHQSIELFCYQEGA
jgi:hypothetical protein